MMSNFKELTIKELTQVLYDSIKDVKAKSIDRFEVRSKMVRHIRDTFSDRIIDFYDSDSAPITFDEVIISSHKNDYSEITVTVNCVDIDFKVGVKGTKEYEEVSKTRKKEYVIPNKITFAGARKSITHQSYKYNHKTFKVEFDRNCWSSAGIELAWGKSEKNKIGDLLLKENLDVDAIYANYYEEVSSTFLTRSWMNGTRLTPYRQEPALFDKESITTLFPDHWVIASIMVEDHGEVVTADAINDVVRINVAIDYEEAATKHCTKEFNWEKSN